MCQLLKLVIQDEEVPLVTAVRRLDPATVDGNAEAMVPMVELCAKVMLYLQTPNAVRIDEMRDDEAIARLARVSGKRRPGSNGS